MFVDHPETDKADWNIQKEYYAPVKIRDDKTAGERAQHRTNQTRDRNCCRGSNQFRSRERPHNGEAADGHHHGSSTPLQDAAGDQEMDVARYATEERAEGEQS